MPIKIFTIPGYAHLYRSLLRFCGTDSRAARELVYTLNTANLDSFRYLHPDSHITETGFMDFNNALARTSRRPYRTEVQLYKSLLALKRNIVIDALTENQREALANLRYVMSSLELHFYKAFGIEIYDRLTVYSQCTYGLIPQEDEPGVCLVDDWALMPGA